ncbi:MAG: hypothetical protein AAB902_01860 [Patescibacteria group bacterium]
MRKLQKSLIIYLLIIIILVISGSVYYYINNKNNMEQNDEIKKFITEKYEFAYPSDWSIKKTSVKNKTFIQYDIQFDLQQNSAKEGEIGKWLKIVVCSGPEYPQPKTYSKDMVSGQLIIAGEKYDRVDLGSGLFLYYVVVKKNSFMFEFNYNSSSAESANTRIIETIIQSLKFK